MCGKSPGIFNIRTVCVMKCNLSAKELGLECIWLSIDHFPALVSGAVDAPEWACVLVGITFKVTESGEQRICIRFYVKLIIRLCKLLGWLWRLQLWATGDWQLHHDNMTVVHHVYCRVFWLNIWSTRWLRPLHPWFASLWLNGFSPNWNLLKWKRFQTQKRFRKIWQGRGRLLG